MQRTDTKQDFASPRVHGHGGAMMLRVAIACAVLVSVADILQPMLLPWIPKFAGSILGAIAYAAFAFGLWHRARWAAQGMLVFAALAGLGVLASVVAHWAQVDIPVRADKLTALIWVVQVCGAVAAKKALPK